MPMTGMDDGSSSTAAAVMLPFAYGERSWPCSLHIKSEHDGTLCWIQLQLLHMFPRRMGAVQRPDSAKQWMRATGTQPPAGKCVRAMTCPATPCTPLDSVTVLRCDCLDVCNESQMNERLLTAEVKQLMNRPELGKKLWPMCPLVV